MLLTRDQFREAVFKRDNYRCVVCGNPAKDAHHIIERRLFPDGGYYLDNGASVCALCHLECEKTNISVEGIRHCAGIQKKVLPPHLYGDQVYDKWGNIIQPNGQRLRGELFYDDTVQKILHDKLTEFVSYVKYPRTFHLPWSPGLMDDDRKLESLDVFMGRNVIVHDKLDGENTSVYSDHVHARSLDSDPHVSRTWVKNFVASFQHDIPPGWRLCGENLYAKHAIKYTNLSTYFYGFSIWNEQNVCLPYDETREWFKLLGVTECPVLYEGVFDIDKIKSLYDEKTDYERREGYVVRIADSYAYKDYRKCVGKYVRKNHVQTSEHWKNRKLEKNELR